jgi:hypothetical protein
MRRDNELDVIEDPALAAHLAADDGSYEEYCQEMAQVEMMTAGDRLDALAATAASAQPVQEARKPMTAGRTVEDVLRQQEADAERFRMERMRAAPPPVITNGKPPAAAPQPAANAWVEVSDALDRVLGGPLLKLSKQGEYTVGSDGDVLAVGTRVVGYVDRIEFGWARWSDGVKTDEKMGRIADGFCPAQRSELGDNDKTLWEVVDGKAKDPWQFGTLLPVVRLDTDETYAFVSSAKGALRAANKLVRAYGTRLAQGKAGLPVIELRVGDYMHRTYRSKIFFPIFHIVNYTTATGAPAAIAEDLQDTIPF